MKHNMSVQLLPPDLNSVWISWKSSGVAKSRDRLLCIAIPLLDSDLLRASDLHSVELAN